MIKIVLKDNMIELTGHSNHEACCRASTAFQIFKQLVDGVEELVEISGKSKIVFNELNGSSKLKSVIINTFDSLNDLYPNSFIYENKMTLKKKEGKNGK